jgi:hypothetical protein
MRSSEVPQIWGMYQQEKCLQIARLSAAKPYSIKGNVESSVVVDYSQVRIGRNYGGKSSFHSRIEFATGNRNGFIPLTSLSGSEMG